MTLSSRLLRARQTAAASAAAVLLVGCGGGSPLGNPPTIENPTGTTGQKLSFAYFQRCINPILLAQLTIHQNGQTSVNTCASAGCHDNSSGTGGALRVIGGAPDVDLSGDLTSRADEIRAEPIYVSFYSSQGSTVIGSPDSSRLLNKPLVRGTLHGGGLIFESPDDPNAKLLEYWITHPMPAGQDEFGASASNLFEPADVQTGACKTQ
ncbi:MAG: hypothetical protein KF788_12940 [Piscinibacter sp.]|nr:hypothetical protein [Piscinibacter sp.]